ncbi:hydrolase [Candidatus Sumerlaeota bacterium]|nr:hydrolase [Candidatus Sumerlaeota bacterium]
MENKLLLRNYEVMLLVIDVQEKLMAQMFNRESIIANLRILIQGLQLLDVPIVLTEQYPKGIGKTEPAIREVMKEYNPIEKMTFSVMDNESAVDRIGSPDKSRYILTAGVESHVCVLQTTLSLLEKGFNCGVVVDCTGSRSEQNYKYAIERMRQAGATLLTTEMVLFELLQTATHPVFKQILHLIK